MPQVVIEARGRTGLVRYFEEDKRVEVEHPMADVRAEVVNHYEREVRREVSVDPPPNLGREVTDFFDYEMIRGIDSPEAFRSRTRELLADTGVQPLWKSSGTDFRRS